MGRPGLQIADLVCRGFELALNPLSLVDQRTYARRLSCRPHTSGMLVMEPESCQSLLPRREPGELVANRIGFDFDFERAREVRDRSPQVRLASAAGRTGRPRLPTPSRWPHASQQAGNALGERQGSAVARAGGRGAGGRGQGGSPGRENRAHTTARRLTSTVIGPPPLRRRPRD